MKTLIRLHQVLVLLAILSGCYSPELSDCTVTCGGSDECAAAGTSCERDCTISVIRGPVTATAIVTDPMHPFDKWDSSTCDNQPATCSFLANSPTTITAKFK